MNYLVIDTETGGIGPDVSLLSVYMGLYDENYHLLNELDFLVKPDDGIFKVTGEALEVNKIDLITHEKKAVSYKIAKTYMYNFLAKISNDGKDKPLPLGHNVQFDILGIKRNLVSDGTWNKYVSYRVLDTGTIGQYLKILGRVPSGISGSLVSYADHFGIDRSKAHTAKGDCEITMEIFKRMVRL